MNRISLKSSRGRIIVKTAAGRSRSTATMTVLFRSSRQSGCRKSRPVILCVTIATPSAPPSAAAKPAETPTACVRHPQPPVMTCRIPLRQAKPPVTCLRPHRRVPSLPRQPVDCLTACSLDYPIVDRPLVAGMQKFRPPPLYVFNPSP